jgi:hypothetical protein
VSSFSRPVATGLVLVTVAALAAVGTTAAVASHFRASGSSFVASGDAATWTITTAWAVDDGDYVFSDTVGDTLDVTELGSYGDAPATGASTGTELALTSYDNDESGALFDRSTEVLEGDLASLGDGIYEVYTSSCCRIGGVENTPTDSFSAWARFTKAGSTYDLPPAPTSPTLYALLNTVGDTVIDFRAVDPEGQSVTYTMLTDPNDPSYGADPLPCSTFTGGLLTVGPTHCTGSDVYTDLYLAGTFWAIKIVVSDPAGNELALDSLLHVLTAPEPYIDYSETVGNGTTIDFFVYENEGEPMDSITVTCESRTDPTDVVSGTSATSPVRVAGFTDGSEYDCAVEATNGAGTGSTAYDFSTGEIVLDGVQIQTDLEVGDHLAGTEVTLVGDNLMASSAYDLVQHSTPVTLYTGTTSGAGNFVTPVTLGSDACVAGVHELVLSGVSSSSAAVQDTVWYELDTNCAVLQFSRLGPVTASAVAALAVSGLEIGVAAPFAAAALLGGGALLLVLMRRRTRQSA